ncbi:AAA domain-containing protein [Clostridium sp. CX1]|uniref:AAA domain-containing protein n=1 Tax=Clostridium sp. CX1 TaxID=2978346 RepID=UPI0021BFF4CC|nr:AAA domain-containing protein [Clostridium sp. CX1]MCT8975735.1 AAA domain-containing protein [Clostridium sp. CX1]
MDYRECVKDIFLYLLNVKKLGEKVVKNIWGYDKFYLESQLKKTEGCVINKNPNKKWWVKVGEKSNELYTRLLSLYREIDEGNEDIEIVWGHGLMAWKVADEGILHPILTTKLKLNFNSEKEVFTLNPQHKTLMETDIFSGIDVPNLKSILEMEGRIRETDLDPRETESIINIFSELTAYLSVDGKVIKQDAFNSNLEIPNHPVIYDCSVFIIKRNNAKLWNKEITNIVRELDRGYPIPKTIKALVKDVKLSEDEEDVKKWNKLNKRLFFPLPSNDEQKEIVKRISKNYGVVVQGTPGTGKTHTLANLICHLMANGKRVLVTSETDRALRVLLEKIPEQVRPFCLSILGKDTNSLRELEESIKRTAANLTLDKNKVYKKLEELEMQLKNCKETERFLYNKLDEIEKVENRGFSFQGQNYKVIDAVKWVTKHGNEYSWIEDNVEKEQQIPLNESEFNKLLSLLKEIRKEDMELYDSIAVTVDKLSISDKLCKVVTEFKRLSNNYKEYTSNIEGWRVPDNNRCNYDGILNLLKQCRSKIEELENDMFEGILSNYSNNKIAYESFNDIARKCNDYMSLLSNIRNRLGNHIVQIPENVDIYRFNNDLNTLYNNLTLRGRVGRFFRLSHPECNYIIRECRIDGNNIESIEQVSILKLYAQKKIIWRELKALWNNTVKQYGGKIITEVESNLDLLIIEEYIKKLNIMVNWNKNYKSKVISMLGRISAPNNINWYKKDSYDYLISCIEAIRNLDEYDRLKAYIQITKKWLCNNEKLRELYTAVDELDTVKIKHALNKIERVKALKNKFLELNILIEKLQKKCPLTAEKIINNWQYSSILYKDWVNAWRWAKWNSLLKGINDIDIENIEKSIDQEKDKERKIIEEIVAKRTLYNQILKTTEREKKSLFAWMQAMKKLGRGTGKSALEYRKIAQKEMEECKDTIPVWIMPLNAVIENISLSCNLFDVIIIDESSQSNIFSICALARAEKAVIVGDDKQLSPEPIGINYEQVEALISRYLKKIPNNELFDLHTSLYNTALRVFPNRLILKEHFRCLPEIINFSNETCYSRSINSLRHAGYQEGLKPPVMAIKVDGGYRDKYKPINVLEAECLVNKMVECCKDERYSGMTFGVISLLGESQSCLIEEMIREKLGQDEIAKRKINCGDAYSFQGDERDVMFLSMVVSNNVKFTSLTKDSDIRRFNVATTRAKNQMWLFHSIDLKDLKVDCVRYSLLNYCLNHKSQPIKGNNLGLYFKSNFQKDVYEMLIKRGYSVIPKVNLGTYKVDFIIRSERNEAAIICEGEGSYSSSRKESIEEKLELKRMGWDIFRIRGCEFYYNPEETMEILSRKLKSIGIEQDEVKNDVRNNLKIV